MGLSRLKRKGPQHASGSGENPRVRGKPAVKVMREATLGQGEKISVGDDIMVKAGGGGQDFIAKVLRITHQNNRTDVHVQWYYRPEDTVGGAKKFHGESELFISDHFDVIELASVNCGCNVHSLKDYQDLTIVGEKDYFSRFQYKPAVNLFKPDRVPVYCTCEMPYNPDKPMIQCEDCSEWYHWECLGLTAESAVKIASYKCENCRDRDDSVPDGGKQSRSPAPKPGNPKGKAAAKKAARQR